jgi:site-specific recombinase XerD
MVRKIRDKRLETRTGRFGLEIKKKPVFVSIGRGLSIGYRRTKTADGTWIFRRADGKGGMLTLAIGKADDFNEADGVNYLDFWQAQDKVKEIGLPGRQRLPGSITVRHAFDNYLPSLEGKNPRSARTTKGRLDKHFFPGRERLRVVDLTKTALEAWLASMVKKSGDKEAIRRSKDSANRVLSMVKAFLNHAKQDEKNGIPSDNAWRLVKPFRNVAKPREIRFSPEQARRLIANVEEPEFADVVEGSYLTGARYEEQIGTKIMDFDRAGRTLHVSGKTGSRDIILQKSALSHFLRVTKNRSPDDFIYIRPDGSPWKPSHQIRRVKKAIKRAGLDRRGTLYALRHAYISEAIERNTPIIVIAENCGTSVRMIEITYAKILKEKARKLIEKGAPRMHERHDDGHHEQQQQQ